MGIGSKPKIKKMSPQFLVRELDQSVEFYVNKLGFRLDFRYEDFYLGIIKDGFSIHLKVGEPSADERRQKRNNEDLDLVFSVEGIEELYHEYLKKSVPFAQPLREMAYGKEFYVVDPDGYLIAFIQGV
jgi:catechol 2,3-dioxygenase-like lactoylglutathione lyase family enzyme